jgi:hypothetical protein
MWALGSVANSLKNFLASPEEKFGRWGTVIFTFRKFGSFWSNRPKFGRRFVLPPHFFSALFDLCSRKISQLTTLHVRHISSADCVNEVNRGIASACNGGGGERLINSQDSYLTVLHLLFFNRFYYTERTWTFYIVEIVEIRWKYFTFILFTFKRGKIVWTTFFWSSMLWKCLST